MFVVSSLFTSLRGEREKTGWIAIRIMCPSGGDISADYCPVS